MAPKRKKSRTTSKKRKVQSNRIVKAKPDSRKEADKKRMMSIVESINTDAVDSLMDDYDGLQHLDFEFKVAGAVLTILFQTLVGKMRLDMNTAHYRGLIEEVFKSCLIPLARAYVEQEQCRMHDSYVEARTEHERSLGQRILAERALRRS
jgi:hypothetical protein